MPTDLASRTGVRVLDTAQGVLIGLLRCDAHVAFETLIHAAHRHSVSVFALAEALVSLASAEHDRALTAVDTAARSEWAELLNDDRSV